MVIDSHKLGPAKKNPHVFLHLPSPVLEPAYVTVFPSLRRSHSVVFFPLYSQRCLRWCKILTCDWLLSPLWGVKSQA